MTVSYTHLDVYKRQLHELALDSRDRDAYDVLTLVIGNLHDTLFYMDRDDIGEDMQYILLLPRAEAGAMQAAHPRAVEARLLPLSPGLDMWQPVSYTHLDVYKRQKQSCLIRTK